MKICFVTKSDYNVIKNIGRIRELPKELNKLGNEVSLISAEYSDREPVIQTIEGLPGVTILSIGRNSFLMSIIYFLKLNLLFFRNIKKLSETDYFILDYNSVLPLLLFILLSKLNIIQTNFILDVRSIPVEVEGFKGIIAQTEYDAAVKLSSMLCAGITTITEELAKDVKRRGFNSNKKICIWTSGVNTSRFNINSPAVSLQGFIHEGDFVLIHHGVLSPNRGLKELVKSIPLVINSGTNVKLLIVGDGHIYGYLKEYIKNNSLENNIMLTGLVSHDKLPEYIAVSNAGIIPLPNNHWWNVSSPQKLFEYLAMGKNVIVSDIIAHRSVLGENSFTSYLKQITPECIAENIIDCSVKWKDKKQDMEAVKVVYSNYTWADQASKLNNYLIGTKS